VKTSPSAFVLERMSVKEAANYLGCAEQTMANWRMRGKGPRYIKRGGRVFYRRSDLDAWEQQSVIETSDSRAAAA
jgi:excisionase family DNA binding protein